MLQGLDAAELRVRRLLLETLPRLSRVADIVLRELGDDLAPAAREHVTATTKALAAALGPASSGAAALETVGDAVDAMLDALQGAVRGVVPEKAPERPRVERLLDSGRSQPAPHPGISTAPGYVPQPTERLPFWPDLQGEVGPTG